MLLVKCTNATQGINSRGNWRLYFWQKHFTSFVMDCRHTLTSVCYIELNPSSADLMVHAGENTWGSTRTYLTGQTDLPVNIVLLCSQIPDWASLLILDEGEAIPTQLRSCKRTGPSCGNNAFVSKLEPLFAVAFCTVKNRCQKEVGL